MKLEVAINRQVDISIQRRFQAVASELTELSMDSISCKRDVSMSAVVQSKEVSAEGGGPTSKVLEVRICSSFRTSSLTLGVAVAVSAVMGTPGKASPKTPPSFL